MFIRGSVPGAANFEKSTLLEMTNARASVARARFVQLILGRSV